MKEENKVEPAKPETKKVEAKTQEKPKVQAPKTETKKEEPKKQEPKTEAPKSKYKDGTFTGSAKGYNGDITVSVTISGDKITAVNVVSGSDDEPYFSTAKALTSTIVSNQSADVATVSGATFSSNGIIGAAKNAISQAKN